MPSEPTLKIGWATHTAVVHACKNWHYSGNVPRGKTVKIGAWEGERFVGVIIFSRGATPAIGRPYGLNQTEICELVRIAMRDHVTPVSRMMAIALRFLRKMCPGVRMVISYADTAQNHHGGIYQAGNWIYVGRMSSYAFRINGKIVHARSLHSTYGTGSGRIEWIRKHLDPKAERITDLDKHKYVMPLDETLRAGLEKLRQPYPKRAKQAMAGDQPAQRQGSTDPRAPSDQCRLT